MKLAELLKDHLKSVRADSLREDFQRFCAYTTVGSATQFLDQWCYRTMQSQLEPMKKVART